jgi:hypothetical protein
VTAATDASGASGGVGCTNSRHAAKFGRAPSPYEAGVDTARFLLRVRDERDQAAIGALCEHGPSKLPDVAARAQWFPSWELLAVEGHPAEVLGRRGLAAGDELGRTFGVVRDVLRESVGVRQVADVGLSRVDCTATFRFERPADGWAVLTGLHALDAPRMKPGAIGRPIETVEWRSAGGRRRLARAYDKGVESGTAPAGTLIRLEAQQRFRDQWRHPAHLWNSERVADEFGRRFAPLQASTEGGLVVASERVVAEQLRELVEAGRLTPNAASTLLGHMACESVGIRRPNRTTRRHRAALRRLGLALALDGIEDGDRVDVDLAAILDGALAASF